MLIKIKIMLLNRLTWSFEKSSLRICDKDQVIFHIIVFILFDWSLFLHGQQLRLIWLSPFLQPNIASHHITCSSIIIPCTIHNMHIIPYTTYTTDEHVHSSLWRPGHTYVHMCCKELSFHLDGTWQPALCSNQVKHLDGTPQLLDGTGSF